MTRYDWWVFLTSLRGRVSRFDYNVKFLLLLMVVSLLALLIDYAYLGDAVFQPGAKAYASLVVNVACLWPMVAVSVKRMHDLNYRGWWLLAIYIMPIIIGSLAMGYFLAHGNMLAVAALGLLLSAILITVLIVLSCAKGTVGPNRFGPDPKSQNEIVEGVST